VLRRTERLLKNQHHATAHRPATLADTGLKVTYQSVLFTTLRLYSIALQKGS
jgi:hypothetical protein